jgi:hypothetical protein
MLRKDSSNIYLANLCVFPSSRLGISVQEFKMSHYRPFTEKTPSFVGSPVEMAAIHPLIHSAPGWF